MEPTINQLAPKADSAQLSNCIPPNLFARNEFGLICDGTTTYVYNPDGTINWRKMIKPEFLVPNKQVFERKGTTVPTTVEGLSDSEILILLGGIKELAATRGYSTVDYEVTSPAPEYVVAVCSIDWIPNYETQNRSICFSGIGDASPRNTTGFGQIFLGPIAENRAFCRAVRNFLKINIVSQEEVGGAGEPPAEDTATTLLREIMQKFGITFEKLKGKLIDEGIENAANFTGVDDIPRFKQFELIERIKNKAAEQAAAAAAAKT
jgi:hypothetical protein